MTIKERIHGTVYRAAQVAGILDEETRTVELSFSSEEPVTRFNFFDGPWLEVLGHKKNEVNLDRLNSGGTLHYNHSRQRADRIGAVVSAKLKGRRGTAVVRFSQRDDVNDVWGDVRDGLLTNVSVGYNIDERVLVKEAKGEAPSEYRVTRWTPMELSIVDIPADHGVGVGRTELVDSTRSEPYRVTRIQDFDEEADMLIVRRDDETDAEFEARLAEAARRFNLTRTATETLEFWAARVNGALAGADTDPAPAPADPAPAPAPAPAVTAEDLRREVDDALRRGREAEARRRTDIEALVKPFESRLGTQAQPLLRQLLDEATVGVAEARARLLDALGTAVQPVEPARVVETSFDKFREASILCLLDRGGLITGDTAVEQRAIASEVRGYTLIEMARRTLELKGENTGRLGKQELVGRAFTTSDFPQILMDVANKAMKKGFSESEETWNRWCSIGSLSDFKIGHRVNLSSFDALQLVAESGEYRYGTFTDEGETIQLATYGRLAKFSRQSIINDDLNAFVKIPMEMGRSADRTVGDLAYGTLIRNPVMSDGQTLFSGGAVGTAHGNSNVGGASAISIKSVDQMKQAMARQTDAGKNATGLNIRPSILLCPLSLEDQALLLQTSETDPDQMNSRVPNRVRNTYSVVSDSRLDVDSSTRWYMTASTNYDTIEVAFLDGQQEPFMEQQQGWEVDGTEFKVRLDVGVAALEYRTMQRNDGV